MSEAANGLDMGNMNLPVRRGPGRPAGSTNRPKLSPYERATLKQQLGPSYLQAVLTRARAELRVNGLRDLIRLQLGREELARLEADVIAEVENASEETSDAQ